MRSADEVDSATDRKPAAIESSGSTVIRSPKQVRDRSDELKSEVKSDDAKMAEVVHGLGPDLVARHGVRGAAERIAQLYDTLSVDAVSLALLHLSGETGGDEDDEKMDAGGDGSEASEAATEFDDDSPVYVGYIRGDRSVVKADLRDETVRSGVVELLFDLNSGCLRSSGAWGMSEHVSREGGRKILSFFATSMPCVRWAPSRRSRPH